MPTLDTGLRRYDGTFILHWVESIVTPPGTLTKH